ncbi:hypothetical protein [Lysinibacillus xylanilyticus]|uniref:hypothetical protein n=1 Tax=Lysinibacillus xylanilyticus TaxID=582475 RepID=UPI0036DD8075
MSNDLDIQRSIKLQQEREILEGLMKEWDDPSMSKDISENSARDDLLERIKSQEQIIAKLEQGKSIPVIPGTWNIGDKLYVTYLRIVSYGKDKEVPKGRVKVDLVDSTDITTLGKTEEIDLNKTYQAAINTALGAALLHKAHDTIRINTDVGYCEVEVERRLI